jgi:putative PEP-CTERM system integral membrane protein
VFGVFLFVFTATLLVAAPVAVPILYISHWRDGIKKAKDRLGFTLPALLTAGGSLITVIVFILLNRQPQHKAYALLTKPPQTVEEAWDLLLQKDTIREGLLNAYLAPVRYISAVGEVGHIQELYKWSLKLSDETALTIESAFEVAARPVLYEPMAPLEANQSRGDWMNQRTLQTEPQKAAQLYEAFFDTPIIEGERETIVNAVKNTWSGDQALMAWQAVDDREILLTQQEINLTEHGDWAEVELFEAYQNQTSTRQEVVYYFSLPETAVITGLWLGNSPEREERFSFHVAPRGAAQQVYREQLRINLDPALLEQVGPRQYRLRVFPIEPQTWRWDDKTRRSSVEPGSPLYMWMTYRVLAAEGQWVLPQLAEKVNVYWDSSTVRKINGNPMEFTGEAWLPQAIPASNPITPTAHRVTFSSGETVYLYPADLAAQPTLPPGLRLAVVLDRSYSMDRIKDRVGAALGQLETIKADVDVYLTSSAYRGENASVTKLASLAPNNIAYYGGQNAADLLKQFFVVSEGQSYDAALVFTDGTGFKLGGEETKLAVPDLPIWMIHLDGEFPLGYDDSTLQAIQGSGGGVAGSLEEALNRLAFSMQESHNTQGAWRDLVDGYEWLTIPAGNPVPTHLAATDHSAGDPFAALAARRLILSEMQKQRGQIDELETLDFLHSLAIEQGIATPYSSMIVLVTRAQENRLEDLEKKANRFEREAEGVGETTLSPFEVTGVPEPHEWLLIGLGIALLIWYSWQRRLQ